MNTVVIFFQSPNEYGHDIFFQSNEYSCDIYFKLIVWHRIKRNTKNQSHYLLSSYAKHCMYSDGWLEHILQTENQKTPECCATLPTGT